MSLEQSYWSLLPMDLIYKQVEYFDTKKHFASFCGDPYIREKFYKDENSHLWKTLFHQNFSLEMKLRKNETIMSRYLKEKEGWNKIKKQKDIYFKLHFCAKRGYEKLFFSFIEQNEIDLKDLYVSETMSHDNFDDLLIIACKSGNLPIVNYLLQYPPNDGKTVSYNITLPPIRPGMGPITIPVERESLFNIQTILEMSSDFGHLHLVKYALENKANIHHKCELALMYAIGGNNLNIVKYLVEKGADVKDGNSKSLQIAIDVNNLTIFKYLHKNGADIHTHSEGPLRRAAFIKCMPIVHYIIKHGGDVSLAIQNAREFDENDAISVLRPFLSPTSSPSKIIKKTSRAKKEKSKIPIVFTPQIDNSNPLVSNDVNEPKEVKDMKEFVESILGKSTCQGKNKSGKQCSRKSTNGSNFCWQHC